MFFYFYDTLAADAKKANDLTQAENRLIELGINGRTEKMSVLRNAKEMIEDGIKKGAHTVVAVGDDASLVKVINIVANHDVTVGFIPLDPNSSFAKILGIPNINEACNILSKRLIKKLNLGKANQNYFVASLNMPQPTNINIECDESFTLSFSEPNNKVVIYNLGNFLETKNEENWQTFSLNNNTLQLLIQPQLNTKFSFFNRKKTPDKPSLFPLKKIKINSEEQSLPIVLDETTVLKTPVTVSLKAKKISLIVGKDRKI